MTVQNLLDILTVDKIAIIFYYVLLPSLVLGLHRISGHDGNESPYKYLYSLIVYAAAIPGVMSAAVWVYSTLLQSKSLWELDFFIYYLPSLGMAAILWLISLQVKHKLLPWFGELYELLTLIGFAFGSVLIIIHFGWIPFRELWQVAAATVFIFMVFNFTWDRFQEIRR